MLPTILTYIVVVAAATLGLDAAGFHPASWQFAVAMLVLNIVLLGLLFGVIDRGRLVSPAYSRLDKRNLDKLRRATFERERYSDARAAVGAGGHGGAD
jgi:hypothetical protein